MGRGTGTAAWNCVRCFAALALILLAMLSSCTRITIGMLAFEIEFGFAMMLLLLLAL